MTDTQGDAVATLARTKRIEIQHFADGGSVRRTTVKTFAKPSDASAVMAQMPPSHASAPAMPHGGPVHGPGTPTSDSVPIWASKDEFMLPADTTAAVGKDNLQALVDATHTPTNKAAEKMGSLARADGGDITRIGNSYSGGNVGGSVSINGQAPGGTVSTVDSFRAPPPPAQPPVLGAPVAMTPIFPKPVAAPAVAPAAVVGTPAAAPALAAPAVAPAPLDYASRNSAFNASADARTSSLQAGLRSSGAPAPGTAAAVLASRPVQGIASYADGGAIDDPQKPLTTFVSPDAVAQVISGMAANARTDMQKTADVQLASLSPKVAATPVVPLAATTDRASVMAAMPITPAPAPASSPLVNATDRASAMSIQAASPAAAAPASAPDAAPKPYVAEIPLGRYEQAAPMPDDVPATAPAAAPVAAPAAPATPVQTLSAPPAQVQPTAAADTATASPNAQAQLAALPAASSAPVASPRANPLGSMADTQAQLANLQASNAAVERGGLTVIDNGGANRNADFNDSAALRTLMSRGAGPGRNGAQAFETQVAAAAAPIQQRAAQAALATKEAGDTSRALIAERGTDARAKLADVRQQQSNQIDQQRVGLEGKKIVLDANRDDRAAAAAAPTLALAQRKATLQAVVADPTSTPAQRQAATQQIANMEGKEVAGNQPPAGYERTPDGNLKYIKGGPADPDTPKGKNNLTDTQAKALQFGSRMQDANTIFDDLEKRGKVFSTLGANNSITGGVINQVNSAEGQQLDQAKRNFVNAVLRRESGAAIAPSEFDSADKQYFPQVGDGPEVIAQKRANRELSMRGILAEVPDAETRLSKIRAPAAAPAGATPAAAPTAPTAVPAKINSAADVAALPSGATFVGPDGKTRRKP